MLEKILKEIFAEIKTMKIGINEIKEEHGRILSAILESKEVQRGEIDNLVLRTAILKVP